MLENLIILTYRNFKTANERIPLQDWKLKVRYWTCLYDNALRSAFDRSSFLLPNH